MAASRMPEPVALIQFRPKTAGSFVGLGTTGGVRSDKIVQCCDGELRIRDFAGRSCQVAIDLNTFSGVFIRVLPVCVPHMNTMTLRMIHGTQARVTSARL